MILILTYAYYILLLKIEPAKSHTQGYLMHGKWQFVHYCIYFKSK